MLARKRLPRKLAADCGPTAICETVRVGVGWQKPIRIWRARTLGGPCGEQLPPVATALPGRFKGETRTATIVEAQDLPAGKAVEYAAKRICANYGNVLGRTTIPVERSSRNRRCI